MRVNIPFRAGFKVPMLKGVKVMTVRPRRMGNPGDTFEWFEATFLLTHVMRMRLEYVAEDCYVQEGCESADEFVEIYTEIHPVVGFDPDTIVWAHCFNLLA